MPKQSLVASIRKLLEQTPEPLHYEEITKRLISQNLWGTSGKTPSATVSACLSTDLKRNGATAQFIRPKPGYYALNSSPVNSSPLKQKRKKAQAAPVKVDELPLYDVCSFTDAAERILEASQSRHLHYRDITRMALEQHMVDTAGKTPEATMYAQILTEVKRCRIRNTKPRFMLLGKGIISLTKWQASGIAYQVDEANKHAREKLLKHIKAMKPYDFEGLIKELLLALGFENVDVTTPTNDGGIDVRGTLVAANVIRTRLAVQVKRWKHNIQAPVIQQVRGSLGTHEQGLIITTSDFSKGAKEEAIRPNATPVALMNGEQLVDLLIQNEIGITLTPLQLIQLYTPRP